jgi:hypothetical protein
LGAAVWGLAAVAGLLTPVLAAGLVAAGFWACSSSRPAGVCKVGGRAETGVIGALHRPARARKLCTYACDGSLCARRALSPQHRPHTAVIQKPLTGLKLGAGSPAARSNNLSDKYSMDGGQGRGRGVSKRVRKPLRLIHQGGWPVQMRASGRVRATTLTKTRAAMQSVRFMAAGVLETLGMVL